MLRSILLSVEFKITSYTKWAADLKENHLHAILSGFVVGDTPGTGTFYDFHNRLWLSDNNNLSDPIHPQKEKPKNRTKKGKKPLLWKKPLLKTCLNSLTSFLQRIWLPAKCFTAFLKDFSLTAPYKPASSIFLIFPWPGMAPLSILPHGNAKSVPATVWKKASGTASVTVFIASLTVTSDGIPTGECYYFGYDLYMMAASDSENDLPVFPFLGPASRHDSIGFLYNWFSMQQFLPQANVTKLLLDSAHDAMPYYEYCRDHGITPFIDLNADRGRPPVYKNDFTINNEGVPICREGHVMRRDGTESAKGRTKYKCPKISFAGGNITCTCENPCSNAKYGRTVHLVIKDNPRLFNDPPRGSREWKQEFNARTSAERCNKREKVDYKLEDGRYRSSKMWYCRLFVIMMCQHLDAWTLPKTPQLKDVL